MTDSTPVPSPSDSPPRWLNPVVWVLLPVAIVVALEVAVGRTGWAKSGYRRVEQFAREQSIEYLFVGTSRTWAAVHERAFEAEYAALTGNDVTAVRAGIGNSTNAQHVRGVRNVLRAVPEAFEATVVLIESRDGIPGSEAGAELRNRLGPGALEDVFRLADFPALLASALPAELKATTAVAWCAPPLAVVPVRPRIRRKLLRRGELAVRRLGWGDGRVDAPAPAMADGGGLRTDAEGVRAVREVVQRAAANAAFGQEPIPWGEFDLLELVDAFHAAGARVVLLEIPLCTADGHRWRTDVRRRDAARIAEILTSRGVDVVRVPAAFSDEDFPDKLHLDLESAARFTRALAADLARRAGE